MKIEFKQSSIGTFKKGDIVIFDNEEVLLIINDEPNVEGYIDCYNFETNLIKSWHESVIVTPVSPDRVTLVIDM